MTHKGKAVVSYPYQDIKFICSCEDLMRSACKGLPFYKKHAEKDYCVLHYPGKEKSKDFELALHQKLQAKDFDFRGVWFPSRVDFQDFEFSSEADFQSATFNSDAYFVNSTFRAFANFTDASFNAGAYFDGITFDAVVFSNATFNSTADFISSTFTALAYFISTSFHGDADFSRANFYSKVSFRSAIFLRTVLFVNSVIKDDASFFFILARFSDMLIFRECIIESKTPFNFDGAIFVKPDQIIFHTMTLAPYWFINIDPRKFDFVNIEWGKQNKKSIISELNFLSERAVVANYHLLALAYSRLAVNAEENNRYSEAADFRYAAMLTRSLEIQHHLRPKKDGKISHLPDLLHLLYGFVSGYGESVGRAVAILVGVWLVFAIIYSQADATWWQQKIGSSYVQSLGSGQQVSSETLNFNEALVYSAAVITLQKPEPLPATESAKVTVLLETIVGPLQTALLALAIRRKFMRR